MQNSGRPKRLAEPAWLPTRWLAAGIPTTALSWDAI